MKIKGYAVVILIVLFIIACTESPPTTSSAPSTDIVNVEGVNLNLMTGEVSMNEISDNTISASTSQAAGIQSRTRSSNNVTNTKTTSQLVEHVEYRNSEVYAYNKYTYDAAGERTQRIRFKGPGTDNTWFNTDDEVVSYVAYNQTINSISTTFILYVGAGADLEWFTNDDAIHFYQAPLIDASNAEIGTAAYTSPGADGNWLTADDNIRWATSSSSNTEGNDEWIQYRNAGPDENWLTIADNEIGHFSLRSYNLAGEPNQHVFYRNPGPDKIPFNEDDIISFYHQYFYNTNSGALEQVILFHGGPGVDDAWFSPDDIIASCTDVQLDTNGLDDLTIRYNPGADASCFSADDVLRSYHNHGYNPADQLMESSVFNGPGPNGQWFPAETDANGNNDDDMASKNVFATP